MEHASIYRIFRMLEMLGSNVDYTTPELTERLDVCERSTFRYIETLKLAGCTIIKKGKNIHKLVKIPSEGIKLEELVLISSEEAFLIHRMLRSIAGECPLVYSSWSGLGKEMIKPHYSGPKLIHSDVLSRDGLFH